MKIELMKIDDYEQVWNLWINIKGMGLNNLDESKEGIERFLKRNPTTCFVARENDKIIGVIMAGHDGRRGFIYHTAVLEEKRKQGVAGELLATAMKALQKEDIKKVALVVFDKNEIGNSFWEKAGFSVRKDLIYRNKALEDLKRIDT